MELELIVQDKNAMESAKKIIFDLLEILDINPDQSVRDSYLEIYLERKKR